MSQKRPVERKHWMSDETYRAKQLSSERKAYSLWSASPNIYHDNCYTLRYDISTESGFSKFGFTYFYLGVKGMELQDVVQEILKDMQPR